MRRAGIMGDGFTGRGFTERLTDRGFAPQGGGFVPAPSFGAGVDWSVDAESGWNLPSSATEWDAFIAAKGLSMVAPSGLFLCQETSGDLADSIGSLVLAASGTSLAYQQTISGWSRKGAGVSVDGASGTFVSTDASLPAINTTSMTTLAIVNFGTGPAAVRTIIQQGTTRASVDMTNVPALRAQSGANSALGSANPTGATHLVVIKHDRTNSVATVYTDQEKLSPAFGTTTTGKRLSFGAGTNTAAIAYCLYLATWFGADAEISDANMKALAQAIGASIPWS
jgi:hypothetical protein